MTEDLDAADVEPGATMHLGRDGTGLSPEEGDPAPQVEQTGEGGRHIGERSCREDAASPLLIVRRQIIPLPEDGKGTPEAGVPLDGKGEKVDQRGDPHRGQSGHQDDDTRDWGARDSPRDRNPHHQDRPDLLRALCDPQELGALCQWLVAQMILNGVPDLVGGNRNRRERFAIEDCGRQADSFADRIVVVALLGRFDGDVLQVEPIEQVPGQFSSGPRIVRTGGAMLGKHPLGPELRPDKNQTDDDHEQNETYHRFRFLHHACWARYAVNATTHGCGMAFPLHRLPQLKIKHGLTVRRDST